MSNKTLTAAQKRTLQQVADPDYKGTYKSFNHDNSCHYRYPNLVALLDAGMIECEYWVSWGGKVTDTIDRVWLSEAGREFLNQEAGKL